MDLYPSGLYDRVTLRLLMISNLIPSDTIIATLSELEVVTSRLVMRRIVGLLLDEISNGMLGVDEWEISPGVPLLVWSGVNLR